MPCAGRRVRSGCRACRCSCSRRAATAPSSGLSRDRPAAPAAPISGSISPRQDAARALVRGCGLCRRRAQGACRSIADGRRRPAASGTAAVSHAELHHCRRRRLWRLLAAPTVRNRIAEAISKLMRKLGGAACIAVAGFLTLRGGIAVAAPLFVFGLGLLGTSFPMPWTQKSPGQRSRVRTGLLAMELDHDSGRMDGEVLAGPSRGASCSSLSDAELEVRSGPLRHVRAIRAWRCLRPGSTATSRTGAKASRPRTARARPAARCRRRKRWRYSVSSRVHAGRHPRRASPADEGIPSG